MNIKKSLLICLAGCCIGTGVGVILYANIGGDTVTVFQDGMHRVLNISYGQASRLYNTLLIICALIFARRNFGVGTVVSAFITGYAIDFVFDGLTGLNLNVNTILAYLIFMVGQTIYTIGLAVLIRCNLGMNSLDSLLYRLDERTHIGYRKLRMLADLLLTIVGAILGGVVGVGTILSVVLTGFMIDFFTKMK